MMHGTRAGSLCALLLSILAVGGTGAARAEAQERPIVVVGASANSEVQAEVWAGWPVVVEVRIQLTPDARGPLSLSGTSSSWSDAFRLECKGPDGNDRASSFVPAFASEKTIELTRNRSGVVVWILEAVGLPSLPEGSYSIRATVDEKKLGSALPAGLRSNQVELTVNGSAPSATPAQAQRKCRAMIGAAIWKNDLGRALAIADAHLATTPNDLVVLCLKGKVQRLQGKKEEALASFEAALDAAGRAGVSRAIQSVVNDLRRELAPAPPAPPPEDPPAPAPPWASPQDAEYARDPRGQWAQSAEASSEYGSVRCAARQATGAPDVKAYGDRPEAWASKAADGGEEWLKLTYATPVRARGVRVRQTLNPGAIVKVEAIAADGRSAVVYSGRDSTVYPKDQIAWFVATFDPPPFPVQAIRVTLDSARVKGWNEIDAVQLVGER